jgi:hypothetical protein
MHGIQKMSHPTHMGFKVVSGAFMIYTVFAMQQQRDIALAQFRLTKAIVEGKK